MTTEQIHGQNPQQEQTELIDASSQRIQSAVEFTFGEHAPGILSIAEQDFYDVFGKVEKHAHGKFGDIILLPVLFTIEEEERQQGIITEPENPDAVYPIYVEAIKDKSEEVIPKPRLARNSQRDYGMAVMHVISNIAWMTHYRVDTVDEMHKKRAAQKRYYPGPQKLY